jgi:hypothetical protein
MWIVLVGQWQMGMEKKKEGLREEVVNGDGEKEI